MTRHANLFECYKQQGFSFLAVLSFLARKTSEAQLKVLVPSFCISILALVQVARSSYSKSFFRWRKVNRVESICLSETVFCSAGLERHLWPVDSQELYFARTGPFRLGALFTPRSSSIQKVEISIEFFPRLDDRPRFCKLTFRKNIMTECLYFMSHDSLHSLNLCFFLFFFAMRHHFI